MTTGLCVKAERVKQNRTGDRGCHPHIAVVTLQRCSTFDTSTVLGVGFSLLAGDVGRGVEQRRQVRFQRRVWFQCLRTSSASAAPLASITQLNGCCRSHGGDFKAKARWPRCGSVNEQWQLGERRPRLPWHPFPFGSWGCRGALWQPAPTSCSRLALGQRRRRPGVASATSGSEHSNRSMSCSACIEDEDTRTCSPMEIGTHSSSSE